MAIPLLLQGVHKGPFLVDHLLQAIEVGLAGEQGGGRFLHRLVFFPELLLVNFILKL